MASATPDLRLPSQPRGITALWLVPNYTAWWQRHMCVNNLPKVVTRQCPSAESNLRPWVTSGLQVRHVTVRLPSHTHSGMCPTLTPEKEASTRITNAGWDRKLSGISFHPTAISGCTNVRNRPTDKPSYGLLQYSTLLMLPKTSKKQIIAET